MIIKRIIITNWKNFPEADIKLGERAFFVGPNASGKSNLLDVFRFLRDVSKAKGGGLQQAIALRGGVQKIRSLAARKNPLIEVEVFAGSAGGEGDQYRYQIGIKLENKGKRRTLVAYERVWRNDVSVLARPDPEDKLDEERLTRTHLENPNTNDKFRPLTELFTSVSYLHLVPQLLRTVSSADVEGTGDDYYGRNFLVRVAKTPERIRNARLKRIQEALSKAVPQFDGIRDSKDDAGVPHLQMRLKHWRKDAGWQSEDQFSDGTIRMLGIFWSMQEGDSVLLFEEPELSLNDRIVEQLPGLLWKLQASKGRQVILTTHSSDLLADQGIRSDEVYLLQHVGEGTSVTRASEMPEIVAMVGAGMSIGEAILPKTAPDSVQDLTL